MQVSLSKNEIINALVKSIIDFNPEYFKPNIESGSVKSDAISKKAFYKFFERMVCTAKASSVGKLTLRIEDPMDGNEGKMFCFYDEAHVHARLTLIVVESEDSIWIEIFPF